MILLTGYNGILEVVSMNNKFHFATSITDDEFSAFTIPPETYGLDSLNDETKQNIVNDGFLYKRKLSVFNQTKYRIFPFFGSIIELKPIFIGSQICFVHNDPIRGILGFDPIVLYEKQNSSF